MKPNDENGKLPTAEQKELGINVDETLTPRKSEGEKLREQKALKSPPEIFNPMKSEKSKIIFVYNADSGMFNLLSDVAHKIFSPQTYPCNLCAITHGTLGMKEEWREYLKTLKVPFEFLHADEFKIKHRIENVELPAVFKQENGELQLMIDSKTINSCHSVDDLRRIIDMKFSLNE